MLFEIDHFMLVIKIHITGCNHKIRSGFIDGHWNIIDLGNPHQGLLHLDHEAALSADPKENHEVNDTLHNLSTDLLVST